MKRKLSPRALYGLIGLGLLVYALLGWFVLVSPKRAEAGRLDREVASAQASLAAARAALAAKDGEAPIAVADIFRLTKAMPSVPDMAGILLELSRVADETGIEFKSITPAPPQAGTGYQRVPISLVFDGNFYELSDLLFRLRTLVSVRSGELHASGRLFSIETLDFAESADGFPEITATLTVTAYVYGTDAVPSPGSAPATTPPAAGATAPATTAPATTAPATTTPAAEGAEAAPTGGTDG